MKKIPWILLLLGLIGCKQEERFVKVADESLPKSVMITVETVVPVMSLSQTENGFEVTQTTRTMTVSGAGVFVSPYGHVLSCAHLFELGKIETITVCDYYNACSTATPLYKDHRKDLGLVKIDANTAGNFARLADPRTLRVGQEAIAIGNPLGMFEFSVSHGIISALNRDQVGYNMTQSDTFINPGNSGGGLFNLKGELIGINSQIYSPVDAPIFTGIGMSINPSQIITFLTMFRGVDASLPKYGLDYWEN